jgi:hypothetical protein
MDLLSQYFKLVSMPHHTVSKKCKRAEYDATEGDNDVETCEETARGRDVDELNGEGDSKIKMDHQTKSSDVAHNREKRNAYRILVGKREKERGR